MHHTAHIKLKSFQHGQNYINLVKYYTRNNGLQSNTVLNTINEAMKKIKNNHLWYNTFYEVDVFNLIESKRCIPLHIK